MAFFKINNSNNDNNNNNNNLSFNFYSVITDKVVVSCVCMRGNKLVPLEERIMAEDHPQRMTLEDYSSFATP